MPVCVCFPVKEPNSRCSETNCVHVLLVQKSLSDGCSDSTDVGADTLGAARKAGLHLNCNHDDSPLSATDCLQSCVGAPFFCSAHSSHTQASCS